MADGATESVGTLAAGDRAGTGIEKNGNRAGAGACFGGLLFGPSLSVSLEAWPVVSFETFVGGDLTNDIFGG